MLIELFTEITQMGLSIITIFLVIIIARMFLIQISPRVYSYALWAVLLFRLLCPITIEAPFSAVSEEISNGQFLKEFSSTPVEAVDYYDSSTNEYKKAVEDGMKPIARFDADTKSYGTYIATAKGELTEANTYENSIFPILSYVWIIGIIVLISYSIISFLLLRNKLRAAVQLSNNIYLADYIDSPFVLGIFRAKIYLPSSLKEHEREYIILHEKHHIKRGDHIVKLLAFATLCIHWMNPFVWVSYILAMKDMEMSCDEAVLMKLGADIREEYSASLLNLSTGRPLLSVTPLAFGEGDTKSRIKNVMNWNKPFMAGILVAIFVCIFVAIFCVPNLESNYSTKSLSYDDITELTCSIYEEGNDVKSTWLSLGAYPGLKQEFVDILNSLDEKDFIISDRLLNECNATISYRTQHDDGYELLVKYNNGITSFSSKGKNKELQTTDVELANYMVKLIQISSSDEPHIRNAHMQSPNGVLHNYYEMSDFTYKTDDHAYKYRYERTGKLSDSAAAYTTYVILSNKSNITFDQAAKSMFSSHSKDFFDPEETIIVAIASEPIDKYDRGTEQYEKFENILGYSGICKIHATKSYYYKTFYAQEEGASFPIAETSGSIDECYNIDVDKDGVTELICNVTYGDGLRQTQIYKRVENKIYRGFCDDLLDETYDNIFYAAEYSFYVPEENVVRIHYWKSDIQDYAIKDYEIDLSKIDFSLY